MLNAQAKQLEKIMALVCGLHVLDPFVISQLYEVFKRKDLNNRWAVL